MELREARAGHRYGEDTALSRGSNAARIDAHGRMIIKV
jgi:hypothetical protein